MIPYFKLFGRLGNNMFQGAYIIDQVKKGYIPDIYLQGEEYFDDSKKEIKALYSQGIGKPVDMVAIHVRRGDYITTHKHFYVNLMETPYYEKAMAEFPDESFLIFSDDIEWCKNQKLFKDCEFSEGNNEIDDLNLMASCEGVIMANSSFSWWGAFLSEGKVIAPNDWFMDGKDRMTLPSNVWKKI